MTVKDFPNPPAPDDPRFMDWARTLRNRLCINDLPSQSTVSTADETYLFSVSANAVMKTQVSNLGFTAATQAQMETATSNTVGVTPLSANWHPGVAKCWVEFNKSGTVSASWNITSITDSGAGDWTVNIATDMSSGNYAAGADLYTFTSLSVGLFVGIISKVAGSFRITARDSTETGGDPPDADQIINAWAFGDQ